MHISDQLLPEKPALEIHPGVVTLRPDLTAHFGPIIAIWADIEARLDAIFLLYVRSENALAEFQALKGWDRRTKFLDEQIRAHHGEEIAIEVRSILRTVASPAKKRNDIAHGIWAICKELPDDLVIMPSAAYTEMVQQALRAEADGTANLVLKWDKTFKDARVVTINHLSQLLAELGEARGIIHAFMIEKMPEIVQIYQREAVSKAIDHPHVAQRIQNAKASAKRRRRS